MVTYDLKEKKEIEKKYNLIINKKYLKDVEWDILFNKKPKIYG
jgi:hypothetical protein